MAASGCGRDSSRGTAKSSSGQGVGGGGQGQSAFGRLGVRGTPARRRWMAGAQAAAPLGAQAGLGARARGEGERGEAKTKFASMDSLSGGRDTGTATRGELTGDRSRRTQ